MICNLFVVCLQLVLGAAMLSAAASFNAAGVPKQQLAFLPEQPFPPAYDFVITPGFTFGNFSGSLWLPKAVKNDRPIIIIKSGLTTDRYGYNDLATRFTMQGAIVVQFDRICLGMRSFMRKPHEAFGECFFRNYQHADAFRTYLITITDELDTTLALLRQHFKVTSQSVSFIGFSAGAMEGVHYLATTQDKVVGAALTGYCFKGCYGGWAPLPGDLPGDEEYRGRMTVNDTIRVVVPLLYFVQLDDPSHPTQSQYDMFNAFGNESTLYRKKTMIANRGGHCELNAVAMQLLVAFITCTFRGGEFQHCPQIG